jgi:hypothetical protein
MNAPTFLILRATAEYALSSFEKYKRLAPIATQAMQAARQLDIMQ